MTDLTDAFPDLSDDNRFFDMPQARRIVRDGDASALAQRVFSAAKRRAGLNHQGKDASSARDETS